MSLLNTKPRWFPEAVASVSGWINPKTGEVLVSIGNLKAKLEAELGTALEVQEIIPEPAPIIKKEVKMEQVKKDDKKKKPLVEQTKTKLNESQVLLGEVVEYKLSPEQKDITE